MNKKNQKVIEEITDNFCKKGVFFRIIDKRWIDGGDVDIIVSKKSIKLAKQILKKYKFERRGIWPPRAQAFRAYINEEFLHIGLHIGGYIGGLGGGLGNFGKKLDPKTICDPKNKYLPNETQIFIILYKAKTRNNPAKYSKYYKELLKYKYDENKLEQLLKEFFTNYRSILNQVKKKTNLEEIKLDLTIKKQIESSKKGKFNRTLRFIYKIFRPAPYIAFVGCNGVGKSTNIEGVTKKLKSEKINAVSFYSGRVKFQMLPINPLLKLFKPSKVLKTKHINKSNLPTREIRIFNNPILKIITPIIYYIEYLLRYIFKVYPLRVKYDIVLTDRSFIDIYTSPNINQFTANICFKLMINPKFILLYNNPQVLAKRRPEIPIEQLKKQLKTFAKYKKYILKAKTDNNKVVDKITKRLSSL